MPALVIVQQIYPLCRNVKRLPWLVILALYFSQGLGFGSFLAAEEILMDRQGVSLDFGVIGCYFAFAIHEHRTEPSHLIPFLDLYDGADGPVSRFQFKDLGQRSTICRSWLRMARLSGARSTVVKET